MAGHNLAFAAMTLAGSTADRVGRRRVLVVAAAVFSAGFLATALAPSILMVDLARVVSGVGGAGVMAAGATRLRESRADGGRTD